MRKFTLLLMLIVGLCAACGSDGKEPLEKLHGTWAFNIAETVKMDEKFGKMSPEMQAEYAKKLPQIYIRFDVFTNELSFLASLEQVHPHGGMQVRSMDSDGNGVLIKGVGRGKITVQFKKNNRAILKADNNVPSFDYNFPFSIVVLDKIGTQRGKK